MEAELGLCPGALCILHLNRAKPACISCGTVPGNMSKNNSFGSGAAPEAICAMKTSCDLAAGEKTGNIRGSLRTYYHSSEISVRRRHHLRHVST